MAHETLGRPIDSAAFEVLVFALDVAYRHPDVHEAMATEDCSPELHRAANILWFERAGLDQDLHVHLAVITGDVVPDGGGRRIHGKGNDPHGGHAGVGYRYIHTALDDRTRFAYSEIHNDEQAVTAAGFWRRAAAWYRTIGINPQRVITDNGSCYRSGLWHRTCAETGTAVKKTRPYHPQTNGKVERFHRVLLEEWAYIRPWRSETERTEAYTGFIHFNNHHRAHGALGWATPASILRDNLPEEHN